MKRRMGYALGGLVTVAVGTTAMWAWAQVPPNFDPKSTDAATWSCKGAACDPASRLIKLDDRLPWDPTSPDITHFVAGATFFITERENGKHLLTLKNKYWHATFASNPWLQWVSGPNLKVADKCTCDAPWVKRLCPQVQGRPRIFTSPTQNVHFVSTSRLQIHNDASDPALPLEHTLRIYPINGFADDGKVRHYCLRVEHPVGGGGHDGAVHGDDDP